MISQLWINILTGLLGLGLLGGASFIGYKAYKKKNKFKTKKAEDKDAQAEKFNFRVTIADPSGESLREISTFGANKVRTDSGVVMLRNKEQKFEEFYPLDEKHEIPFELEAVNKKIKVLENLKTSKNENPLNVRSQLHKWKKYKHLLENTGGSFMKIDTDGTPHYLFIRYRSVFVPFKWNVNLSHIHAPHEAFMKNVIDSREDKRKKYLQKRTDLQQILATIGLIIMLIMFVSNSWWSYKNYTWADESKVADLQNRIDSAPLICAELLGQTSLNYYEASQKAVESTTKSSALIDEVRKKLEEEGQINKEVQQSTIS